MKKNTLSTLLLTTVLSLVSFTEAQQTRRIDRSIQTGNQPVIVNLRNTTRRSMTIFWVDFNGKEQNFGALPPGQSVNAQTYPGHLWRLGDGVNIYGTYRATNAPNQTYSALQQINPAQVQLQRPRIINQVNPTTGQIAGDLLQKFIDKKMGRTGTQPGRPAGPVQVPGKNNPAPAQQAIQSTGSAMSTTEARQMVDYHNKVRAEVGVGKVTWSPQIAQFAQQWADHLASIGQFSHRPQNQQKYGENLAGGMGYANPVLTGMQGWYGEKKLYRPAGAPFSMKLMPAGHYTQMVWRGTTLIGAGKAVCKSGRYKGWTIIVCNYNPRGNMLGQPAY